MPDLDRRAEIHDLVVHFYREIVFDDLLGPIFSEVAETDWSIHLPRLTDYWCRVVLGEPGYDGWLLAAHRHVHDLEPFEACHFDRWFDLWLASIDTHWSGPGAERAKAHASKVMQTLARHLIGLEWSVATSRHVVRGPG